MTETQPELAYQHLVDARLDAIERYLIDNRMPREERQEVIASVLEQIQSQLAIHAGAASRDDVLRVLSTLDPPEAYVENPHQPQRRSQAESFAYAGHAPFGRSPNASHTTTPPGSKNSPVALTSFVLAIISLLTVILLPVAALFAVLANVFGLVALWRVANQSTPHRGLWMAISACAIFILQYIFVWLLAVA